MNEKTNKEIRRLSAVFRTFKKMKQKERARLLEYITHWHYCEIVKTEKHEKAKRQKAAATKKRK